MAAEKLASMNGTGVRRRPASMTDIARKAGVSQSAVSLVLSGDEAKIKRVSAKTAEKIRRIAQKLHFHPNHAARALLGRKTGVIGAIAGSWFWLPVRSRLLLYLIELADVRGLKLLTWQTRDRADSIENFLQESGVRGIDGLLYLAFDDDADWPAAAPLLAQIPSVVSVLGDPGIEGGSCVLSDLAGGVRQLVAHLHAQGRRKIVQVLENLDTSFNRERRQGFVEAHRELGLALEDDQLVIARMESSSTKPLCVAEVSQISHTAGVKDADADLLRNVALAEDLVRVRGADAILADNDIGAEGLLKGFRRLGIRAPDDVALAGWGNETFSRYTYPALTTIDYRPREVIGAALDLLTGTNERGKVSEGNGGAGVSHDSSGPDRIVIPAELIVRESTG
jgi:LacI family transcriptional regulator